MLLINTITYVINADHGSMSRKNGVINTVHQSKIHKHYFK